MFSNSGPSGRAIHSDNSYSHKPGAQLGVNTNGGSGSGRRSGESTRNPLGQLIEHRFAEASSPCRSYSELERRSGVSREAALEGGLREGSADIDLVLIDERFFEIEDVAEVGKLVALGLAHLSSIDQVEDHPSEVVGRIDRPATEHGLCQQSKLFQRRIANPLEQFGPRDVRPFVAVCGRPAQPLLRSPQRGEKKIVCSGMIPQAGRRGFLSGAHGCSGGR